MATSAAVSGSVNVSIETSGETPVVEVTYDGQEILQPPLTLAEHLAKQAAKIDFYVSRLLLIKQFYDIKLVDILGGC